MKPKWRIYKCYGGELVITAKSKKEAINYLVENYDIDLKDFDLVIKPFKEAKKQLMIFPICELPASTHKNRKKSNCEWEGYPSLGVTELKYLKICIANKLCGPKPFTISEVW